MVISGVFRMDYTAQSDDASVRGFLHCNPCGLRSGGFLERVLFNATAIA
jgi:hypothetical protein